MSDASVSPESASSINLAFDHHLEAWPRPRRTPHRFQMFPNPALVWDRMTESSKPHICRYCHEPFEPAPQSLRRQKFCGKPACRKASQEWSYLSWLARNPDAYKTETARKRVLKWRKQHPDYSRRRAAVVKKAATSHDLPPSALNPVASGPVNNLPLPNTLPNLDLHNSLIIGIIADLFGCNSHNDIVREMRNLVSKALAIQGIMPGTQSQDTKVENMLQKTPLHGSQHRRIPRLLSRPEPTARPAEHRHTASDLL